MRVIEGMMEETEWSGSEESSTLRVSAINRDATHADKTRLVARQNTTGICTNQ